MVYRILENLLGGLVNRQAGKLPKCAQCRTAMHKDGPPLLFLIPVFHDHDYTPSPAYYEQNCTPIRDVADIPTGRRACRFWTLACPECGRNKLLVEDFLKVRDSELVEKRELYDLGDIDLTTMSRR